MEDHSPHVWSSSALGPLEMVVLQGTAACNLNCDYCYLSEKVRRSKNVFPIAALSELFTRILESCYIKSKLVVCWHSGEPLLLGPGYYDEAIRIITDVAKRVCPPDFKLRFDMQTNGTLINDAWCDFFSRHRDRFDLGVSCDGPAFLHDAHRLTWSGRPTHAQVVKGLDRLCQAGIPFNLISVVPPSALDHADALFDFAYQFRNNLTDFHFNFTDPPALETDEFTVRHDEDRRYRRFLTRLLRRMKDSENVDSPIRVRNFDHFYKKFFSDHSDRELFLARHMSRPFRTLNVDANGNITTFYAGLTSHDYTSLYGDEAGLVIGNLVRQSLEEIANSPRLLQIMGDFEASHRACEAECGYFELCSGGFNLTKYARFGRFDVSETPECSIHTKMMVDVLVGDLQSSLDQTGSGADHAALRNA
jgi:uncharacterized protein